MGRHDHYVFMDGCIVKGCKPVIDLAHSFGEYIALLTDLYEQGGWGQRPPSGLLRRARPEPFAEWAERQVHSAQSTQNLRTGAARVDGILRSIGRSDPLVWHQRGGFGYPGILSAHRPGDTL